MRNFFNKINIAVFFMVCLLFFSIPFTSFSQHYNFKNYSVEDGLAQSQVYSFCQDKKGNLWIGTVGGGVSKYDGLTFVNYTIKEGWPTIQWPL
jgi:ligand-binding sensor domain-containing protein